jgi:hypothetical protein
MSKNRYLRSRVYKEAWSPRQRCAATGGVYNIEHEVQEARGREVYLFQIQRSINERLKIDLVAIPANWAYRELCRRAHVSALLWRAATRRIYNAPG